MNMTRLLVVGAFLTSVLLLGLVEGPTTAQQNMVVGGAGNHTLKTALAPAAPVSFSAITWDTIGSFESMPAAIDRFTKETCNQSVEARLQSAPEAIIILREDPRGKSQFRYAVGLRVPNRISVAEPLRMEEVGFAEALTLAHTGPYQQLQSVYESLEGSMKPGWPVVLVLDNDPRRVGPNDIKTRMIVPF